MQSRFQRLRRPSAHGGRGPGPAQDATIELFLDEVVTTGTGVVVRGWALAPGGDLTDARITVDGVTVPIEQWHPRPDVVAARAADGHEVPLECGFTVRVPIDATHEIGLAGTTPTGDGVGGGRHDGSAPAREHTVFDAFDAFVADVAERDLKVLEIGSQVVVTESLRSRFGEGRYVGFDISADDNTDVVGDAHRLSDYFEPGSFDAIFSMFVLEHIAMPWLLAAEISKVLRPGGRTFHATNHTWPLHARPWDFFRFSTDGLAVLFSPPVGYSVLDSGHSDRVQVHVPNDPDLEATTVPTEPAYVASWVLAEKAAEPRPSLSWDIAIDEVTGGSVYPSHGTR